jgi:hypothetical protein
MFCTTAPTIEESNHIEFSPLWMNYDGIESVFRWNNKKTVLHYYYYLSGHMSAAGLSPFTNQWSKVCKICLKKPIFLNLEVHNFTPESAKFTITTMHSQSTVPSHVVAGFPINDKFQLLVVQSPHGLTFLPDESFFFNVSLDKHMGAFEVAFGDEFYDA